MRQIIVIAGPTGSGESTITNALLERFPNTMRLVTATTRAPRSGEVANKDYYFFSKEEFKQKEAEGDILESTYHKNRDVYYGTYKPDLESKLSAGNIILVNPDIVGARYYKEHYGATTIFITPESVDELMERIRSRNPEISEEELMHRRKNAEDEIAHEGPFYDHTVHNRNGHLAEAIEEVVRILRAEGYAFTEAN